MSGSASMTIRSAVSEPLKSGIRTSTDVPGMRARIWWTQAAKASAPPLGKVVPIDRGDHDVLETHPLHCLGEASRLLGS
jgi:hypothetical protein